ncbi:FAS1-like dehydratase domain-containing protein [Burkholderia oklahomensis]|uniref:MaoC like domain protein n=1 Tax=Burkholderia oklahomensis TaxID=342113 RepID=A0AAI8FP66_9BURK|nr:MaoC family dehydratase N-terminal domain-containing protein [Burkholderia oklahomensis]AIO68311.1 maoC like domain protein [Burkholderia oklahomensis]AOI44216.1 acyl-CoA dehydrogenase [Burkholderia oklahomensis EO147]KUY54548.1 acyl-CoA dehydrogenase [Burkholderia oklahomensis EO147]QPS37522.1 MaoC family dehydratase N-terminal domain-containing protein [Burkholderia oklahomensis]
MHATPADRGDDAVRIATDLISPAPAAALAATLDRDDHPRIGDALPPIWHWAYFWTAARQSELGLDGHPRTGGFLPDLGLPRRMAAGGRLRFLAPLAIGDTATRTSRVASLKHKKGRSGRLAFVTVEHVIASNGAAAIHEEQDIVYREPAEPGAPLPPPKAAPDGAQWQRAIAPTEALLFRYSALTFNGHRIHYDRSYAQQAEGYPDLVVHGPLIATLLLDLVSRSMPKAVVVDYAYKAVRPTFFGHAFTLCGRLAPDGGSVELWAKDHDGWLTMSARASLAR